MPEIPRPVPIQFWGKDHWSTLAYLECRAVDHKGVIARQHMRCDPERHPGLAHMPWDMDCPTYLACGVKLPQHDDWDCFEDAKAAGMLTLEGTGVHPIVRFTAEGLRVASLLRTHKANGGTFSNFTFNLDAKL